MLKWIHIPAKFLDRIKKVARGNPLEVCGIGTGTNIDNKIVIVENLYHVDNISTLAREVDYVMDPSQMFKVLKDTTLINKKAKDDFVLIFHSHPNGIPYPSRIDLERAEYNVAYLIYSGITDKIKVWTYDKPNNKMVEMFVRGLGVDTDAVKVQLDNGGSDV